MKLHLLKNRTFIAILFLISYIHIQAGEVEMGAGGAGEYQPGIKDAIKGAGGIIGKSIEDAKSQIKKKYFSGPSFVDAIKHKAKLVQQIAEQEIQKAHQHVTTHKEALEKHTKGMHDALHKQLAAANAKYQDMVTQANTEIKQLENSPAEAQAAAAKANAAPAGSGGPIDDVLNGAVGTVSDAISGVTGAVGSVVGAGKDLLSGNIGGAASSLLSGATGLIGSGISAITNAAGTVVNTVTSAASNAWSAIKSIF